MTIQTRAIEHIRSLEARKKEICKEILEAISDTFPPGTIVTFTKGTGLIRAEILGNNDSWWVEPRTHVRNLETGKEYSVYTYHILKCM